MKDYFINNIKKISVGLTGLVITNTAFASYSIGSGTGGFTKITSLLQSWVDFMTGPYGKAIVAGSIILGVTAWAVLPKEGILGYAVRGAVVGAVVFNIGTWMGMFG